MEIKYPMNKDTKYLEDHGWKIVNKRGSIQYWTHQLHQPNRHGFFTKGMALRHQRMLDKTSGVCSCVKPFDLRS